MRYVLCSLVIITLITISPGVGAEETQQLPKEAQSVLDKLAKNENKLNQEHIKAVNSERRKAIDDLNKVLKNVTKTGDLDTALAVRKQIEELQAKIDLTEETDLLGNKKEVDVGKVIAGTWNFQKNNGQAGTLEIQASGQITAKLTHPFPFNAPGKWEVDKDGLITINWFNDPKRWEKVKLTALNKMAGDSHDAGQNGFNATRLTK